MSRLCQSQLPSLPQGARGWDARVNGQQGLSPGAQDELGAEAMASKAGAQRSSRGPISLPKQQGTERRVPGSTSLLELTCRHQALPHCGPERSSAHRLRAQVSQLLTRAP